jgi:protein SCO1
VILRPLWVITTTMALLAAACGGSSELAIDADVPTFAGVQLDSPMRKPDAVLTDTGGDPFDLRSETDGVTTLVYFGYTNCPDICPVYMAQVQQILADPNAPDDVEVVFVTVDPERDTGPVVREWLDKFDEDFIGLTGTPEQLERIQREAGVSVAYPNPDDAGRTVAHAAQVIAYAPNGYAYSVYPFGTYESQWADDLQLIDELTDAP